MNATELVAAIRADHCDDNCEDGMCILCGLDWPCPPAVAADRIELAMKRIDGEDENAELKAQLEAAWAERDTMNRIATADVAEARRRATEQRERAERAEAVRDELRSRQMKVIEDMLSMQAVIDAARAFEQGYPPRIEDWPEFDAIAERLLSAVRALDGAQ